MDTSPCPVQLSCPGRHRGVRGMVLAFVCWLQCCSAAVLQPDILRHAGTCCLLPARSRHDAVSPVSNISRQQPIIVVTVLLGDNHHHHCREQEELRIVAGAPDPAPPCRGHMCWLLYLELFILIWLGVIIEPCSAPTRQLVTPSHILEVKLSSKSGLELAAARARHGSTMTVCYPQHPVLR